LEGNVAGTYVHGLFAADDFRHQFLSTLCSDRHSEFSYDTSIEKTLDALADHLEASLNLDALLAAAGG
jgi:adenosylcobyric acid synthase